MFWLPKKIEKDGEIEKLTREATELHKSKRQLMEILEAKDLEISEKNATIKSYLDKIVCNSCFILDVHLHLIIIIPRDIC